MNRLMLGSGIFKREGWKTLDCNPVHAADFVASIPPLPDDVKAVEWDEIEWIHGITSLYPWDAKAVLAEILAVLKPGGRLVLEQPDFIKARERVEWLFGDATLNLAPIMNRWSYWPESLKIELRRTGFSGIEILPAQHHVPERDFRVEAWR